MAINTSTITQLISDFRALSQKDSISPESLGSRREPRPQRLPQRQRRRKTCRIGRRPPRNIVPTRAKLSLLKLCRVQPILCNTAPTAQTLSIHSTSAVKNSRTTILSRCLCREFSDSVMRISPYNRAASLEVQRSIHCPFLAVPERDNFPFLFNSAITRSILLLD